MKKQILFFFAMVICFISITSSYAQQKVQTSKVVDAVTIMPTTSNLVMASAPFSYSIQCQQNSQVYEIYYTQTPELAYSIARDFCQDMNWNHSLEQNCSWWMWRYYGNDILLYDSGTCWWWPNASSALSNQLYGNLYAPVFSSKNSLNSEK